MMIMFPPEKMCNSPSATVLDDSELDKTSDCCFVLIAMGAGSFTYALSKLSFNRIELNINIFSFISLSV